MLDFPATKLLRFYERFDKIALRHSIAANGDKAQAEAGPFFDFLSLVIAPLNRFIERLPASYGAKVISVSALARRALSSRGKTYIQRKRIRSQDF
jgi:hypothetical protein